MCNVQYELDQKVLSKVRYWKTNKHIGENSKPQKNTSDGVKDDYWVKDPHMAVPTKY